MSNVTVLGTLGTATKDMHISTQLYALHLKQPLILSTFCQYI